VIANVDANRPKYKNRHKLRQLRNNPSAGRVLLRKQQFRCDPLQTEGTNMQINKASNAAMAAAAALLFTSGLAGVSVAADSANMHCTGVNSCKGTSECKSAKNSCKGQNSCKGTGWVSMSKADCDAAKAKAKSDASK
jgi:hypothetical protein